MGDRVNEIRPAFNGSLHVEFRDDRITSDGGAVLVREIDELAGLSEWLAARLRDPRRPDKIVHPLVELLRTRLYMLVQGRRDQDDADTLRVSVQGEVTTLGAAAMRRPPCQPCER